MKGKLFAMERIQTVEVGSHVGERVSVAGWLHSLRLMGGLCFLVIRDGWGTIQAVAESEAELGAISVLQGSGMGVESIVAVEGLVVSQAQAPGGVELHQLQIEMIVPVTAVAPLTLNKSKNFPSLRTLLFHAGGKKNHPTPRAALRLGGGGMAGFSV